MFSFRFPKHFLNNNYIPPTLQTKSNTKKLTVAALIKYGINVVNTALPRLFLPFLEFSRLAPDDITDELNKLHEIKKKGLMNGRRNAATHLPPKKQNAENTIFIKGKAILNVFNKIMFLIISSWSF